MSDHGLGTAGTVSAITGTSAAVTDSMGWLNANADGMGILIGCVMMLLTGTFYVASIYLRYKEGQRKRDQLIYSIKKELFHALTAANATEETKQLLRDAFDNVND